jgi:hypothetical protein
MDVKINYSDKRSRTVSARLINGSLLVNAPAAMPRERLEKIIENFKARFERRKLKKELNRARPLAEVAARLNKRYFNGKLKIDSIEYATDQNSRFGCCNHRDARIRISHRLSRMPEWVRDCVIIHEMAHLIEPNHGPAFWDIVSRYELAERAKGYLMAVGLDGGNEQDLESPERVTQLKK